MTIPRHEIREKIGCMFFRNSTPIFLIISLYYSLYQLFALIDPDAEQAKPVLASESLVEIRIIEDFTINGINCAADISSIGIVMTCVDPTRINCPIHS